MDIEEKEYQVFLGKYNSGGYRHQRLGQAFYNHFKLHKLADQEGLIGLYEKDGHDAVCLIRFLFRFV